MRKSRAETPEPEVLTDTQRRILAAALFVFSERGYEGASTAEIARHAGVAEKTLFAQFGTKRELLRRTLRPSVFLLIEPHVFDRMRDALTPPGRTLLEVLRAIATDRMELASRHAKELKLLAHEVLLHRELIATLGDGFQTHIAEHVMVAAADLIERGELRGDLPPRAIARTIVSVLLGYALSRHVLGVEPDADDAAEIRAFTDVLVNGLRPRAPAPKPRRSVTTTTAKKKGEKKRAPKKLSSRA